MTIASISFDGQAWIRDLMSTSPESGFPDIDPYDMDGDERDMLADYLEADDPSLSDEVQDYSAKVADELRALPRSDDPIGRDISEDAHNLAVLCADCADDDDGEPIYDGDEWGGWEEPCCEQCGKPLHVTLVSPGM